MLMKLNLLQQICKAVKLALVGQLQKQSFLAQALSMTALRESLYFQQME